jgi:hypothetical protein
MADDLIVERYENPKYFKQAFFSQNEAKRLFLNKSKYQLRRHIKQIQKDRVSLSQNFSRQDAWKKVAIEIADNLKQLHLITDENTQPVAAAMLTLENKRIMKESTCRGVIDNSYLNVDQINKNGLIFVVRKKSDNTIKAFAVCRFKKHILNGHFQPEHYLYVDVICSKPGGAINLLWKSIFCFVKANGSKPSFKGRAKEFFISGIQLSALTYVIGYYWKKGFRFYQIDTTLNDKEDSPCNLMAEKFASLRGIRGTFKGRFTRNDDRNYDFLYEEEDFMEEEVNQDEAKRRNNLEREEDPWYYNWDKKTKIKVRNFKDDLSDEEEEEEKKDNRWDTPELIIDWISGDSEIELREGEKPQICQSGKHSVEFNIKNRPPRARGKFDWVNLKKKILTRNFVEKKDAGSEGWTMFLRGEWLRNALDKCPLDQSTLLIGHEFAPKNGGKRTKKRALKKRHRKKTKRRVKRKNKRTRRKNRKKTKKRY